jgi:uncharacterized protein
MSSLKHRIKCIRLDVKSVGADGCFEGYASKWDERDLGDDIVVKGAFLDAIKARGVRGIKMLYEHDPRQPIGVWEEIKEDAIGLWVKGRLLISVVEKAREVYELMKEGVIDAMSIGYYVTESSRDGKGATLLEVLDLKEISVVIFPMLESARVDRVKGLALTERDFETMLTQDAGYTRSQARTIIGQGFKALKSAKPGAGAEDELPPADMTGAAEFVRALEAMTATLKPHC